MSASKFVDAAVPLITISSGNKMEIGKQALEILAAIPKPVAVVGVAGQYRTGKSYLLNRVILNQNQGFAVGPTINPCTKGIWMWGRPLKAFSPEGKPVNMIVLDSEGLGAIDEDSGHDSRIFSLIMLLSSCFVYNSTGTIDESALESLSLIIDLTRNIQIRSRPAQDDADLDDFHYYMPAFVWVVRDFSLELTDKHHNPITSNEYFEEALVEQSGDSDQVEQKNRIRRILQNFFTDRSCFTMVRPVNDEEELKQIEALGPDRLRPEFVEQAAELRNHILESAKVKTLEKHVLSGEMLADLLKGYVTAFNTQKVPVIENCWNYVAKNECHKAKEAAVRLYEEEMTSAFAKRWPLGKKALKDLNREYFEQALRSFRQANYGDIQRKFEEDLVFELKRLYQDYKYDNESEFEARFKKLMEGLYAERVAPGLKNKTYKSFLDLENDLRLLEKEVRESNVEGPHKAIFVAEFMARKQSEAFKAFSSQSKDDFEAAVAEERAARRNAEAEADTMKQGAEKEKKRMEVRLGEAATELENAQKKSRMVEESLQRLKTDKEKTEAFYEQRIKEISEETAGQIKEMARERDALAEERNQARKEMVETQSQAQADIALLRNQVQILEERKAALSAADKTREEEMDRLHLEFQTKTAEILTKNEALLREKMAQIDQLNEELMDAEEKSMTLEKNLAAREGELEASERNAKKMTADLKTKLDQATEKIRTLEKASSQKNSGVVPLEKLTEARDRITELEEQLRQKELGLRQSKQQLDKEIALNRQAAENSQAKYDEMRKKYDDLNREYERLISLTEDEQSSHQEDVAKQLAQLRDEHVREIQNLEAQAAILKMRLEEEERRFAEDRTVLEKEKSDLEASSKAEVLRLKASLEKMEKAAKSMGAEVENAKQEHQDELHRLEERYRSTIAELEDSLEALKKSQKAELRDVLKKKEEDLKTIQATFEEEKENLGAKWEEEKEKYTAKIAALNRQADMRLEDVKMEFEETLEAKDSELQAARESFSLTEQALRSDCAAKQQRANELAEQLKILKEKYESYKAFEDNRMMELQKEYERELAEANKERDLLKKELNEGENRQWELQNELTAAVSDLSKFKEATAAEAKKLEHDVVALRAELELWKSKAEGAAAAALQQKTELEMQLVMAQQQAKFKSELNEELKRKLDYEKSKAEERLKGHKDIIDRERVTAEQKMAESLKSMEAKLNEKRKLQRELETKLEAKVAENEKLRASLEDKITNLETELAGKEEMFGRKTLKLKGKVKTWKETAERTTAESEARLREILERNNKLEAQVFELEGTIENKAQIFNQTKGFLEDQNEKLKKDLEESQRQFNMILNKFSKKKEQENSDGQNTQNQIVQSLTENHRGQLNELTQKFTLEIKTLTEKNQKLERELRQLREGPPVEIRAKLEQLGVLESTVGELKEAERLLQKQVQQIRQEKDTKIKALETRYAQDVDRLKSKVNDLEGALKERENALEKLTFSGQSDQKRLSNQIETLKASVKNFREQLTESEAARQALEAQIDRLKAQNRKDRMLANAGGSSNKWGRGTSFATGKTSEGVLDDNSLTAEGRMREPKDLSKAFPLDDISEQDISTNKIL